MPIKVLGEWADGYIMDHYITSSEYIGEDVFGHPRFDTTYTEIGQLLHDMKYNGHLDTSVAIAEKCIPFLSWWLKGKAIAAIVPVPPTHFRDVQPVYSIGNAISNLIGTYFVEDVLIKTTNTETKSIPHAERNLKGAIKQITPARKPCNILLLDDIYSTGTTANECARILKQDNFIENVYFFAIAKTKNDKG